MAAIKRAASANNMMTMMTMNLEQQRRPSPYDEEQQQRYSRRRKLSHSRVTFSVEQPTIHPPAPALLVEDNVLQHSQESVRLWYSREDIQHFLVERSKMAVLLMNLNGNLPLPLSEDDENTGICLRGFEQYFSTAVRQQILARRIEHRTMVLMEQYRQLTDMGHRDPSLLRACIQHISQPAVDEALVIAALDTRAIEEELAACRLFFPIPTSSNKATSLTSLLSSSTTPLNESTTTSGNHSREHRRRVTPSPSFIDSSKSLQKSSSTLSSFSSTSENNLKMSMSMNEQHNLEWVERPTLDASSKLAPISSLTASTTSAMIGAPVVIALPNEQGGPIALSLRFFIE